MAWIPSQYRTPQGQQAMIADEAELVSRRAMLLADLKDVESNLALIRGYRVALGMAPGPDEADAHSKVSLITSVAVAAVAPVDHTITRPPKTWREFIGAALRQAGRSLTTKEILACDTTGDFSDKYKVGPNGFYNTTRMMELGGELVKVGKRYYDPALYARIQSGEIQEDLPAEATRDSIPNIILRELRAAGAGLTAGGIITALGRLPETSAIAERNPALIRTHLTKMRAASKLINDNGTYKLPEWSRDAEVVLPFPSRTDG